MEAEWKGEVRAFEWGRNGRQGIVPEAKPRVMEQGMEGLAGQK